MAVRLIALGHDSATFEVANDHPVLAPAAHIWSLDGHELHRTPQNVLTLHGLQSDHLYELKVESAGEMHRAAFRTHSAASVLDVRKFGARGDGHTDDTEAIQAAIDQCPERGVVSLPPGDWLTAPLFLRSCMELHLARGALLRGHPDMSRWPVLRAHDLGADGRSVDSGNDWEGSPALSHAGLINGLGVHEARICGEGIIDANSSFATWWSRPTLPFRARRPRTIQLVDSRSIVVTGVTLLNSPCWTVHPVRSSQLVFANLRIEAPPTAPNTDGINPESCNDVQIVGVNISTGDDCIAIKSGKRAGVNGLPRPTSAVRISNCRMGRGHSAVAVGSEIVGGVQDVLIENCRFEGTDRGLRIKTRRRLAPAAAIERVTMRNVWMCDVGTPFVVNAFYSRDPEAPAEAHDVAARPLDSGTPVLRDILLTHIDCERTRHCAAFVLAVPENPIQSLTFKSYRVSFQAEATAGFPDMAACIGPTARAGMRLYNVRGLHLDDVTLIGTKGPMLTLNQPLTDLHDAS